MFWPRRRRRTDPPPLAVLWIFICILGHGVDSSDVGPDGYKICSTVQLKTQIERLPVLRNCSVIEGSLALAVMRYRNESRPDDPDILDLSFPELREITGYLLVFRSHFTNLTKLFPNLAVIRGLELFNQYALVVYENPLMTTLGLSNLTTIQRGGVRIEKNQRLCHVESINWNAIIQDRSKILVDHNQDENLCPGCDKNCPMDPIRSRHVCWSFKDCQKLCRGLPSNKTCMRDLTTPCSDFCIGGCSAPGSPSSCLACRNYIYKDKCLDKCPENLYVLNGRRCVTKDECHNFSAPGARRYKALKATSNSTENKCLADCPPDYIEDPKDPHVCMKCNPRCPKTCVVKRSIDSLNEAKKLMDCTIINGSLTVKIKAGDGVAAGLEKYLSSIEEITGYLNVVRTPAVVSFNFLKNLRVIRGRQLHIEKYALVVLDNLNLQEFWDWNVKKEFRVETGLLYFYHNERLCYEKIVELKNKSGLTDLVLQETDVSRITNGDRMSCHVFPLHLKVYNISATDVSLEWDKPVETMTKLDDHRYLYAYTVFYMQLDDDTTNVTEFYGRDACGNDPWIARDAFFPKEVESDKHMVFRLDDLQPYARHAAYVKTNVINRSQQTAKSNITYFRTAMGVPTAPQNLILDPTGSDSLNVRWEPPARPNGLANLYLVTGIIQQDSAHSMSDADYCHSQKAPDELAVKFVHHDFKNVTTVEPIIDCSKCKCEEGPAPKRTPTKERVHDAIDFEDLLHDLIFKKRSSDLNDTHSVSKRGLPSAPNGDNYEDSNGTKVIAGADGKASGHLKSNRLYPNINFTFDRPNSFMPETIDVCPSDSTLEGEDERVIRFCHWTSQPMLSVSKLRHYSQYMVTVRACHPVSEVTGLLLSACDVQNHKDGPNVTAMCCGPTKVAFKRTLKLAEADDVDFKSLTIEDQISNSTDEVQRNGIFVRWNAPSAPNAFIQKYEIEYYLDDNSVSKHRICIDHTAYNYNRGSLVKGLASGNYSFRVRATSVGGSGNWTQPKSFFVKENKTRHIPLIISLIVVMLLITISAGFGVYFYARKRMNKPIPDKVQYASINPEYMSQMYEVDEYEVPREKVKLLHELGQGSFGMVYQGIVFDLKKPHEAKETDCAVKTVKEGSKYQERQDFLQEAATMKSFDSYHVVRLLGVVSRTQPLYVIMELMSNGDLKKYLRSHRPDQDDPPKGNPPTLKQVFQMAAEIADGMAYLSSMKFVHRDLAARNCMVADDLTVKIGDFGMTRDIYETDYYKKGGKGLLPVRWMSPEALKDGLFTVQGDVWSYGVVLWEIVTLATMPYQGLSHEQVLRWVISRHVMERPENCPDKLFEIMKCCWHYNPKHRPKFLDIVAMLFSDTSERFRECSFYATKMNSLCQEELANDRPRGPSIESLPLLARPSSHTPGLQSLVENPRSAADMVGADLDEESNLYISDDVISDGEAEDSEVENWQSSMSRRLDQPGSSVPKTNNSDYGSGKSPTNPSMLDGSEDFHASPTSVVLPLSSPSIDTTLPQECTDQADKPNKVSSSASIQPNGRVNFIPVINHTTAF